MASQCQTWLTGVHLNAHRHREVIAVAALREAVMFGPESPGPFEAIAGPIQAVYGLYRCRVARPALVVEHARRDDELVEDQPAVEIVRTESRGLLARKQVEQERRVARTPHGLEVSRGMKVLGYADVLGAIVEVPRNQHIDLGIAFVHASKGSV